MINKQIKEIFYSNEEFNNISLTYSNIGKDKPNSLKKIYSDICNRQNYTRFKKELKIIKIDQKIDFSEEIHWGVVPSLFGDLLIVKTRYGLCGMAFCIHYGIKSTLNIISKKWGGKLIQKNCEILKFALAIFSGAHPIPVHLIGTNFQIKIWNSLIRIPYGRIETYSFVAKAVDHTSAVRAVASAIGRNPISWLIPCHRIISKGFYLSGYNWGVKQKVSLLSHEFEVSSERFFELQYCCLKRSCELHNE